MVRYIINRMSHCIQKVYLFAHYLWVQLTSVRPIVLQPQNQSLQRVCKASQTRYGFSRITSYLSLQRNLRLTIENDIKMKYLNM